MDITTQKKKRLLKLAEIENGGKFAITENIIKLEEKNEEVDSKLGQIIEEITIPVNQTITFKDTEVITIRGKDGRDGIDGEKGDKGEQGIQGEKGDRGEDGINGRDGKDGENGQDGKDGIDGKDGENGKDGSPDTGEEIVVKINDLSIESDDFKIDASHIKNLPEVTKEIVGGVVSRNLYQLGDVSLTDLSNGQTLVYNSTTHLWENGAGGVGAGTWGSITGTLSNQTDLQTALDAKLDGNGVATYIPFYSDANTLTSEAHLNYDSVNHRLHVHAIAGDATDGLLIESDNGTDIGILGAANTANVTWYGAHNFNAATQDTIAAFTGAGKTLGSLSTTTYPSLTELSYVKGVTSAIQTQLNTKLTSPQIQSLISIRF